MKNVIAVFDGPDEARRAVVALEREDVPSSRISTLVHGPSSNTVTLHRSGTSLEVDLVAALVAAHIQPHHAIRHEWSVRHGRTLVMTTVGAAKAERVARVLSMCGPIERVTAA